MDRKYPGDECAAPEIPSHPEKDQKQQDRREIVQRDVSKMMTRRAEAINLAIEHVAKGRQRMPKIRVTMGQHPLQPIKRDSGTDLAILVNVYVVIEVHEAIVDGLPENDPDEHG